MSSPLDYLPSPISDNAINHLLVSIGIPPATEISHLKVTAQYHGVYRISVPQNEKTRNSELILRVAGNHLPKIKTENEVGVMAWITKNTTIPIPTVVAFDSSTDNPIGHEYTLMSRVGGMTLSDVYETLNEEQLVGIMDQLIDFLSQLGSREWDEIGGLYLGSGGDISVGRVVDEAFWQAGDLPLWPDGETIDSLNLAGPYPTYIDLIIGQISTYIHLINVHKRLSFMRDTIPRLEAFVSALPNHKAAKDLNSVKIRLAHKDLHFANMLYDPAAGKITAILDWEFSGVVPFTKWNPRRSFLWNGRDDDASSEEKARVMKLFRTRCKEKHVKIVEDAEYASPLQDSMQAVADYLRAITEVAPRGQGHDLVGSWKDTMLEHLERLEG